MCMLCDLKAQANAATEAADAPRARWMPRRAFLLAAGAAAATPALAQVEVGKASAMRNLVPAEALEKSAQQQYAQVLAEARAQRALAPDGHPALERVRNIARRLIPHTAQWNERARGWQWEVNVIGSKQINAWCMPGGKIAVYTGLIDQIQATDDELAMVMGHEMAHALREHARERLAKTQATGLGLEVAASLFGLGQLGQVGANLGTQLLTMKYSRDDETEADLVGLEIAARGGYNPDAAVSLWNKMLSKGAGQGGFLSTHPAGPERIKKLQQNVPRVKALYEQARATQVPTAPVASQGGGQSSPFTTGGRDPARPIPQPARPAANDPFSTGGRAVPQPEPSFGTPVGRAVETR